MKKIEIETKDGYKIQEIPPQAIVTFSSDEEELSVYFDDNGKITYCIVEGKKAFDEEI